MFKVDVSRMAAPNTLQKQRVGVILRRGDQAFPLRSGRVSKPLSLGSGPSEAGRMSANPFKNRLGWIGACTTGSRGGVCSRRRRWAQLTWHPQSPSKTHVVFRLHFAH